MSQKKRLKKRNIERRKNEEIRDKMLADMMTGNILSKEEYDEVEFDKITDKIFESHGTENVEEYAKYVAQLEAMGGSVIEKENGDISVISPSVGGF